MAESQVNHPVVPTILPTRWPFSGVTCFAGSIALHVLAFALVSDTVISGQRFRENGQPLQMTVYVGLGDAHAPPPALAPTKIPAMPLPQPVRQIPRPGSGAIGDPTPRAKPARRASDVRDEVPSTFLPSSQMDRVAVPVSEPDINILNGVQGTGLPIRLRLYVNAQGAVKDIRVMQADDMDANTVERLKKMFYATAFIAGRRQGKDMPSYLDIELNISDYAGVPLLPMH